MIYARACTGPSSGPLAFGNDREEQWWSSRPSHTDVERYTSRRTRFANATSSEVIGSRDVASPKWHWYRPPWCIGVSWRHAWRDYSIALVIRADASRARRLITKLISGFSERDIDTDRIVRIANGWTATLQTLRQSALAITWANDKDFINNPIQITIGDPTMLFPFRISSTPRAYSDHCRHVTRCVQCMRTFAVLPNRRSECIN